MKLSSESPKRIVVKIGTSSLVREEGSLDRAKIGGTVGQLADIKKRGKEVILVTSGAIRAGMESLGLTERPKTIPEQQAAAAIGQSVLMRTYTDLFAEYGIVLGQVLLTRDDFHHRVRYLNARNTLHTLLRFGCVPVVNENDTVATDEIKFGENDTLSALVAACADADLLVNLSDVDGLFDGDPRVNGGCKLIPEVKKITPEIERLAGGAGGPCGSGGMRSKIEAAKIATNSGVRMVIANASRPNVITDVAAGKDVGTRFLSTAVELNHRKRWIAFGNRVKGGIVINEGARKMLVERGKSLLSAGIVECEGSFEVGDLVSVVDENKQQIARGFTNYGSTELALIKGKQSGEIESILGYKDFDEVIHRDNLVLGV
ncbi:MAG: glutamate 5-kinase [Armatimonadetes bacterium]|nr:glutamate 5-kinase [Armatimonadota bacterium]